MTPDARIALAFLADLAGSLPRAPLPVPGSEECYSGIDVPTRVVRAAVSAIECECPDCREQRQIYGQKGGDPHNQHGRPAAAEDKSPPASGLNVPERAIGEFSEYMAETMPMKEPAGESADGIAVNMPDFRSRRSDVGTTPRQPTETLIKHMVDRFLGWKLPANFRPDAGISFKATFNEHTPYPMKHEPSGTNLFDAEQATAMVRYMVDGLRGTAPRLPTERLDRCLDCGGSGFYPSAARCKSCDGTGSVAHGDGEPPPPAELGLETTEDMRRLMVRSPHRDAPVNRLLRDFDRRGTEIDRLVAEVARLTAKADYFQGRIRHFESELADALAREATARAEERERAGQIADSSSHDDFMLGRIGIAIRARTP